MIIKTKQILNSFDFKDIIHKFYHLCIKIKYTKLFDIKR